MVQSGPRRRAVERAAGPVGSAALSATPRLRVPLAGIRRRRQRSVCEWRTADGSGPDPLDKHQGEERFLGKAWRSQLSVGISSS